MNYAVVIPARYKSTRLEGKPLLDLNGIPMILRTYRQCLKAVPSKFIFIATDNELIKRTCQKEGAQVIMTSEKCLTGTDRIAEVSEKIHAETYINIQGDEPIFNPEDIKILLEEIKKYPNDIITGYCELDNETAYRDFNVVKLVRRKDGRLLYASRAQVPSNKKNKFIKSWRQVLAYAFPKQALKILLNNREKTELEKIEDVEILRFLELGIEVRTIKMSNMSMPVDNPEDVILVKKMISKLNLN